MTPVEIAAGYAATNGIAFSDSYIPFDKRCFYGPFVVDSTPYVAVTCISYLPPPGTADGISVFKSVDNGATWDYCDSIPLNVIASGSRCHFTNNKLYFCCPAADLHIYTIVFDIATETFGATTDTGLEVSDTASTVGILYTISGNVIVWSRTDSWDDINVNYNNITTLVSASAMLVCVVPGAAGKLHLFYRTASGNCFHRVFDITTGLGAESVVFGNVGFLGANVGNGYYWNNAIYITSNDPESGVIIHGALESNDTSWNHDLVSAAPAHASSEGWNYITLTADTNYLYLVYITFSSDNLYNTIVYSKSTDGFTWEPTVVVYDNHSYAGSEPYYIHNISAGPIDGGIGVVFDLRDCSHAFYTNFLTSNDTSEDLVRNIGDTLSWLDDVTNQPVVTFRALQLLLEDRLNLLDRLVFPSKGGKTPEKPVPPEPPFYPPGPPNPPGSGCPAAFVIPVDQ